jgi:Tol biopolymer transport system component
MRSGSVSRFIPFLLSLFLVQVATGQSFGQNKVQYRTFDWQFIKAPHFDIYYYGDGLELAEFTAVTAEEAYEQISKHLRWTLKKPVSIIVYNSHNDFQQTNVTWEYMVEGIGGVTELFKNRVVLPFEGSYQQFRHVIHHELVHAMINDMIYGGSIQSIISGRQRLRIPLWANEGLAEYLSSNWDTKADMIMRDVAVHDQLPHIRELDYYMAYKGGQSVWRFIAEKYGREKIGEIFQNMKNSQNAQKGFQQALGMDFDDLTEQWHKYLKKEYWPDVAGRDEIDDIAKQLTDHEKKRNYYNISPAISPDGSKIAILSDRSGYADIYLIDAINGEEIKRLVKGNRSIDFEELKWLQPGISWSPDGKQIVLAAKAGKQDAIHLVNVETGKSKKLSFPMDGLFTAVWSPDGRKLAFVGNVGKASDIYVFDLESEQVTNLTADIFSDSDPVWSPDGSRIAFVSDRGPYVAHQTNPETGERLTTGMYDHDFSQNDIYIVEVATREITRLTATDYNEHYPVWAHHRNALLYTADRNGVWNVYLHDLDTGEAVAVTNVLTGIQQLSLSADDHLLVFAGYSDQGWDIYSLTNPLDLEPREVEPTNFIRNRGKYDDSITDLREDKRRGRPSDSGPSGDYSDYIFAPLYSEYNTSLASGESSDEIEADTTRTLGKYVPQPYKTRFTLDMISGNLYISNLFGTQGMTYFAWSDIMGDHQFALGTEMVLTLENSDYFFSYAYLKNRTDFYFSAFQTANFFTAGFLRLARLRHYGVAGFLSTPFNRFTRIDYGLSFHSINYQIWEQILYTNQFVVISEEGFSAVLPAFSWVFDNTINGLTGPVDGFRQNFTFSASPGWGLSKIQFQSLRYDARRYFRVNRDYSFALRLMLGKSVGRDAQKYFLGGLDYWLFGRGETDGRKDQGQYREAILDTTNESLLEDIYFTEYATPVRGARYAERFGTNVVLANFEFRFPFINYLALGFPLRAIFGNIRGHAFLDVGAAWDKREEFTNFQALQNKYHGTLPEGSTPFITGFGFGIKIFMGYFLLRIDTAWDVNADGGYSKPQYYFSLGPDW